MQKFKLFFAACAVLLSGKVAVDAVQVFAFNIHALYLSVHGVAVGQLGIFDGKGHLVRDDFPAVLAVEGDGVGAEVGNALLLVAHILQAFGDECADEPPARVFRVGGHARNAAHFADGAVDVHFHGVDDDLGSEVPFVKPAHDVRGLENGQFGLLHLLV